MGAGCSNCDNTGWLIVNTNGDENNLAIQRCDSCQQLTDDEAKGKQAAIDTLALAIMAAPKYWSGHPDPADPDNYWIDDATGERIKAS